jgi:hypothetical protein
MAVWASLMTACAQTQGGAPPKRGRSGHPNSLRTAQAAQAQCLGPAPACARRRRQDRRAPGQRTPVVIPGTCTRYVMRTHARRGRSLDPQVY